MYHRITHACGHMQDHHIDGFTSQRERKMRWLTSTQCRSCFNTQKRAEQAEVAAQNDLAIAHLARPALTGTDRQVSWAESIRAQRLATCIAAGSDAHIVEVLRAVQDAKWWIDHRELTNEELRNAAACMPVPTVPVRA
ncbi:hypothetical protein [Novosphingobium sp. 9U]|uniref:hypothetical protein n=1 Tax=Novosphingobium sp. 9U TaxID=2653158 RepID=UPI0012F34011|nr:hypothetical protein [Novosphingobium sp. 9U]VWX49301.1 conserved hypothetical protein [Novosphingobium sp. 9U]